MTLADREVHPNARAHAVTPVRSVIPPAMPEAGMSEARVARPAGRAAPLDVIRAYVALTKPRIVELLLVTTVPAMLMADRGMPAWWLVAIVVVGGALAAGSANALNCYLDRDIDQVMRRTSRRPLPQHVVAPRSALVFGLVIGAVAVGAMWLATNPLATLLTAGAIFYYVVVYTLLLKRRTVHNTVLGGVCGAAPVLIGWAAVTGSLAWPAWVMFAVVFLWQPPHFWALAVKFKDDYARVGVPMLPVVASARRTAGETVVYSWLTVAASLALWPLATTPLYGVVALIAGALLIVEAHRLLGRANRDEPLKPMRLFHWSTSYLTVLFVAIAVDALIQ